MTTMSKTLITSRDPQGLHITGLFEAAFNKAKLKADSAQRIIEHGGEFQKFLEMALKQFAIYDWSSSGKAKLSYDYASGYYKPYSIAEQQYALLQFFPNIGYANERIASQPLPENAEGWFVIPKWEKIAKTYGEALEKVLALIKQTRNGKFYNFREGQLGPDCLRQHAKTVKAFQTLADQQKNYDLLIVAAQFGLRRRGQSASQALESMNSSEFGLGAFAVGIMLLTHPERLRQYNDLWIDCAGDEFSRFSAGFGGNVPSFIFIDGAVRFGPHWVEPARGRYGSASAFLAQ